MFLVRSDCLYHYPPLWGELVAVLPQCSYYFSLSKSHLQLLNEKYYHLIIVKSRSVVNSVWGEVDKIE